MTTLKESSTEFVGKKYNIVIAYCYGTSNAGDKAITPGTINLINQTFSNIVNKITVISLFPYCESEYRESATYIKDKYPNIEFIENPLYFLYFKHHIPLLSYILNYKILFWINLLFTYLFPRFISKFSRGIKAILESDIVIFNGGNLFFYNKWRKSLYALLLFVFPLLIAKRLGKPYGILAQTFGPVKGIGKIIIKKILSQACFIYPREHISKENLEKLGFRINVNVVLDTSFFLDEKDEKQANLILKQYGLKPLNFVAITLRLTNLGDIQKLPQKRYEKYFKKLEKLITLWIENTGIPVLVVCQSLKDVETSVLIWRSLSKRFGKKITIINELSPEILKSLYSNAKFLVGMRFHSLVFALSENVPVIGLYYKDLGSKILGTFKELHISDLCFDLDNASVEQIINCMYKLENDLERIRRKISLELESAKKRTFKAMERIKNISLLS